MDPAPNPIGVASGLSNALTEVRKAYRLIWLYQQRLIETIRILSEQFEVRFYQFSASLPGNSGQNPLERQLWEFLPLHVASVLFLNQVSVSSDPNNKPAKNDYLLEISSISDTVRLGTQDRRSPIEFGAPESTESRSQIRIYLFVNDEDREANTNWYSGIWNKTDYPPHDQVGSSRVGGVRTYGYWFDLTDMADMESISNCAALFKSKAQERLGVSL